MIGRRRTSAWTAAVALAVVGPAQAGTVWQWTHEAEGEGWANVFDGGPVVYRSDSTEVPFDDWMSFVASDLTRPGVLGAGYSTSGHSEVFARDDYFGVNQDFSTGYSASSRLGADQTGGEGHGWISSVVEFVMPVDELQWRLFFAVEESPGYDGSMRYVVENVSQGATLLDVTEGRLNLERTLSGDAGDLIRISFEASGAGRVEAGVASYGGYRARGRSEFVVPEATTCALLVIGCGALATLRAGRGGAASLCGSRFMRGGRLTKA